MAHRFFALIIGIAIAVFWVRVRRTKTLVPVLRSLSNLWLGLVIIQMSLGGWTILSNKAADVATAHVAIGAITFATAVIITAVVLRLRFVNLTAPQAGSPPISRLAEVATS